MNRLALRKRQHLDVCLDRTFDVESGSTELNRLGLPHCPIPRLNPHSLTLEEDFMGYRIRLPILISCMTGGTRNGKNLNRILAKAAQECGIPVGTGSLRIALEDPNTLAHFSMKSEAPDVPVLANIGIAQLVEFSASYIAETLKRSESDGLFVHLNAAQEMFQSGGDTNFPEWFDALRRFIETADFPVLIKETGSGILPSAGLQLLEAGAAALDIAGLGGTDWVAVESIRQSFQTRRLSNLYFWAQSHKSRQVHGQVFTGESFRGWGISTGPLLLAYRKLMQRDERAKQMLTGKLIASGGLRSPRDFAVALACGPHLTAAALPFIRAANEGGVDAVHAFVDSIETGIRAAVSLSGSSSMPDFRQISIHIPPDMNSQAEELASEALDGRNTLQ